VATVVKDPAGLVRRTTEMFEVAVQREALESGDGPMVNQGPGAASSAGLDPALAAALDRALLGDREAFGKVYQGFREDVSRLCARLLVDPAEAEDARSEVFLRAREGLPGYDASRPFRTWLLSVTAHHCIDRLRRRALEGRLFRASDLAADDVPSNGPSPLQATLGREARENLSRALDRLDPRYRAPIVLRYFAELSYREIAAALDVEVGQVGVLLHRAKDRLRKNLRSGE